MLESISTLSTILPITSCCPGPVCVCVLPHPPPSIPLYPPTTICTTTQMQPSEGCAHAHLILEDTCPSMQPMRMQWETEDARVGWASHPSHLPSLGCTGCQHSILARAHTLPSCTALQTTLQGFANTRTALNSRSTQSKLWLSSNVMKVLVVKIFNLPFSCIFNSAITVHTSFHQYSILLIKFASVRGWSTALNMCTMEWYIFDVIPSWFEAGVPREPDKTWKLSIGAGIDMYTSSLLYFSTVWT